MLPKPGAKITDFLEFSAKDQEVSTTAKFDEQINYVPPVEADMCVRKLVESNRERSGESIGVLVVPPGK